MCVRERARERERVCVRERGNLSTDARSSGDVKDVY